MVGSSNKTSRVEVGDGLVKPNVPIPVRITSALISGSMLLQLIPQLVTVELSPNICILKATSLKEDGGLPAFEGITAP
jgi:hypothetical protein